MPVQSMVIRPGPMTVNANVGWMKTVTTRTYIRLILLGALVILSLAGFMIHTRIHLISQNPSFIVPFVAAS